MKTLFFLLLIFTVIMASWAHATSLSRKIGIISLFLYMTLIVVWAVDSTINIRTIKTSMFGRNWFNWLLLTTSIFLLPVLANNLYFVETNLLKCILYVILLFGTAISIIALPQIIEENNK